MTKFMTFNAIPFNVAHSPYYDGMISEIVKIGPGVQGPTTYEFSHGCLDMEVKDYRDCLKIFHNFWDEYGCSVMCDRW